MNEADELRDALKTVCRLLGARGVRALLSEPEVSKEDAWLVLRVSPSQFATLTRAGFDKAKFGYFDE